MKTKVYMESVENEVRDALNVQIGIENYNTSSEKIVLKDDGDISRYEVTGNEYYQDDLKILALIEPIEISDWVWDSAKEEGYEFESLDDLDDDVIEEMIQLYKDEYLENDVAEIVDDIWNDLKREGFECI